MGFLYSTYFGLVRINNTGPEAKNWAVTDYNPELTSKIMYALSRHTHIGATPIKYPGYNYATPATPTALQVTEVSENTATPTGGVLAPGTSLGVRASYLDITGLETEAAAEYVLTLGAIPTAPAAPVLGTALTTPVPKALAGGVYLYGITRGIGAGETELSATSLIEIPYTSVGNTSFTVPITFDPIADYTDGTDKLKLYRANGISGSFQLLKTWTDNIVGPATPVTFTDTGQLEDATITPPIVPTFNRNKLARITLRGISHPAEAVALRVYITQTPGVYGTNHLLEQVDLTTPTGPNPSTPTKNTFNYLGSETLAQEYPKEFSQLPTLPGKINLGTEAFGAPTLSTDMTFAGYRALQFVLPSGLANAASTPGALYYDDSTNTIRALLGSTWTTLASPTGSFSHSTNEPGGHSAKRIYHSDNAGGRSLFDIASILATPTSQSGNRFRKVVQPIYRSAVVAGNTETTSSSFGALLSISDTVTPEFAGQWAEFIFSGDVVIDPQAATGATVSFQIEINTALGAGAGAKEQTYRSIAVPATPTSRLPVQIYFATPLSSAVTSTHVLWLITTGGKATALANRSTLYVKLLL